MTQKVLKKLAKEKVSLTEGHLSFLDKYKEIDFINLSESSKVQATTSGFEVFEDVLGRLKFTVDGSSVPQPTKSTISNQDNFDNFFNDSVNSALFPPGRSTRPISVLNIVSPVKR